MRATRIMQGRRESTLLALPSVQRMAEVLTRRCREDSWVRTSIASLDRFRVAIGSADLELLLTEARADRSVAERALSTFASSMTMYTDSQISALAMGPKLWLSLNGVEFPWRPLLSRETPGQEGPGTERVILASLIGSGLQLAELLRLRLGEVGTLNSEGSLIPDLQADPLAVQFTPRRGKQMERVTFLTYQARQGILSSLAGRGISLDAPDLSAPLFARYSRASIAQARERSRALIRTGSDTNVALCRATGNFFREWGLPGSHFSGTEELNLEEFI